MMCYYLNVQFQGQRVKDGMDFHEHVCIILLDNFAHMFMCVQNIFEDPDIGTVQGFPTESVQYRLSA